MQYIYHSFKLSFVLVALLLTSCTNSNEKNSAENITKGDTTINPSNTHLKDFTYAFENESQKFKFPNRKSQNFHLSSGTTIKIPNDCFVDETGSKIKGEVELVFEEFLTPGSIISSQINMKYDSAGSISDFESAGMFRINAFQDGKTIFIAKDKSIEVSLATVDNDKDFNSYYSTQNGDDWQYIGENTALPNKEKKELMDNSKKQLHSISKPLPPVSYSANGKYFDLNLSHTYTHGLKSLLGIVWEYAGSNKKNDPAVNKIDFNRNWDYVNILPSEGDKRGVYDIVLQNKDTTIKTIGRPVYRGVVLDIANKEFAAELGEFNKRMNQIKNEQKQASAEASFLRVISVKNLGLYNYDRQYHAPDMIPVLANFNFGADSLNNYPISVYLITGNGMAVIKYPPHDYEKFMYSRKDINKLIAILPNYEICTFSALRFEKEGPVFPESSPGKFMFKLNHTGIKATNSKAIDQVLGNI